MNAPDVIYKSQSIEESLTPPKTPPTSYLGSKFVHSWPAPETVSEVIPPKNQSKNTFEEIQLPAGDDFNIPHQDVLLLHGPKQKYAHTKEQPVPKQENDMEMLVAVHAVGLNPIDWKAP
jgi:hypothetical protein